MTNFKKTSLIFLILFLMAFVSCSNDGGNGVSLSSITVTPANVSITKNGTKQFTATGTYSDGTSKDITTEVTWTSGTTSIATINTGGLATGVNAGVSVITASINSITGKTNLTVTSAGATTDVYVAGEYKFLNIGPMIAAVWKNNNKRFDLTSGVTDGRARSVFVNEGIVYVVGKSDSSAMLWKIDGETVTPIPLPVDHPTSTGSDAVSVYISDNIVYVAGNYYRGGVESVATLWTINGEVITSSYLTDGNDPNIYSYASSIYVSNGIVYIAGRHADYGFGINGGVVWKNTSMSVPIADATFKSIYVSNDVVYVAGYNNNGAVVWEDGSPTVLDSAGFTDAKASSVFVSDGVVYVLGAYYNDVTDKYVMSYWKNNDRTDVMQREDVEPYSIYVYGSDVYMAGGYFNDTDAYIATVFKNTDRTDLTNASISEEASGNSVFVYVH